MSGNKVDGSQGGNSGRLPGLMAKQDATIQQYQDYWAKINQDIQTLLTGKDGNPISSEKLTPEQRTNLAHLAEESIRLEAKIELEKQRKETLEIIQQQQNSENLKQQRELKMSKDPSNYELEKMMAGEKVVNQSYSKDEIIKTLMQENTQLRKAGKDLIQQYNRISDAYKKLSDAHEFVYNSYVNYSYEIARILESGE